MPNDEARTLLGRAVEAPIENEIYFSVIALLERNGEILRGRGRGGAYAECKHRRRRQRLGSDGSRRAN